MHYICREVTRDYQQKKDVAQWVYDEKGAPVMMHQSGASTSHSHMHTLCCGWSWCCLLVQGDRNQKANSKKCQVCAGNVANDGVTVKIAAAAKIS